MSDSAPDHTQAVRNAPDKAGPETGAERGAETGAETAAPPPASSLLLADIAMRAGSYLLRDVIGRNLLKKNYGAQDAKAMVRNKSLTHKVASLAAGKLAAKSPVGAAVIGGAILTKIIFDRGGQRKQAQRDAVKQRLEDQRSE